MKLSDDGFNQLKSDENFRELMYNDATGLPINWRGMCPKGNPTIGYGWNLLIGLDETLAETITRYQLTKIDVKLARNYPDVESWPQVQYDVAEMIDFNTGSVALWVNLISTIRSRQAFSTIARQVRNSLSWTRSGTHARYERFAQAIENNAW